MRAATFFMNFKFQIEIIEKSNQIKDASYLLPPDQFVASLHIHQQLVRLRKVVLGIVFFFAFLSDKVMNFTWISEISLQWKESALSISPFPIASMLSISYSQSLSATFCEGELAGSWLYVGHSSSQASHSQEKRKFSWWQV